MFMNESDLRHWCTVVLNKMENCLRLMDTCTYCINIICSPLFSLHVAPDQCDHWLIFIQFSTLALQVILIGIAVWAKDFY